MFEILIEKIGSALKNLTSKGKLTEKDIDDGLRQIRLALLEADVHYKAVKFFLDRVKERAINASVLESLTPGQQIVKIVNEELTDILGRDPVKLTVSSKPPTVIMLVGLQGSGKTTTAAKLAGHLKKSGQFPLLVAADTRRPAAIDQLNVLGKQLDVPVYTEYGVDSPVKICRNAMKKAAELSATSVILDTQGRLHIDEALMKELKEIKSNLQPAETLLVVDAMIGQDAVNVAGEFNSNIALTGLILTKIDGDARGGAALSIKYITGIPIKFVGTGEKSSALELFYPDRMASRILGMGDMLSLIEKTEQNFSEQQAKKLQQKIRKNELDLDDFLSQLKQLKNMGPLSQVMQMVPGMSKLPSNAFDGSEEGQMKRIEAIILSMTPQERQNPDILNGSRRKRIARGSGTEVKDVNRLLNQFSQLKKFTKMASNGKLPKNFMSMMK
jgi:signal recognition particle subunit SRP54